MGNLIVSGSGLQVSKSGTGPSLGGSVKLMKIRSESTRAYRLRRLEVGAAFSAPGAGYAYSAQWQVQRRPVDVDPINRGITVLGGSSTGKEKTGEHNVIAADSWDDGDSYSQYTNDHGIVRTPWVFNWDVDIAPLFLQELYLYLYLYVNYDGTPTRAFGVRAMAVCHYENIEVSREHYKQLATMYASLSLR